jgi:hypothetical protein
MVWGDPARLKAVLILRTKRVAIDHDLLRIVEPPKQPAKKA